VTPVVERTLTLGGLQFHVAEAGQGPPVVLLHGFPDDWRLWRHQIPALAEAGHRVLAPDLRGFGASARPGDVADYRIGRLVGDVAGLLDAHGIERADVVGHDWGAGLAWSLALALPGRVRRLTVVSTGHAAAIAQAGIEQRAQSWYMLWFLFPGVAEEVLPVDDWAFFRALAWGGAPRGSSPDLDRQLALLERPGALTAALAWYRANIDPARFVTGPSGLRAVTCPTMGIWSTGDAFLSRAQMTGSQRYVDGPWRYEEIDGVDHWVPVHAPQRLTELLVDFLRP
jgi:pimeloyl-ACP methyl ester carboxylesterase